MARPFFITLLVVGVHLLLILMIFHQCPGKVSSPPLKSAATDAAGQPSAPDISDSPQPSSFSPARLVYSDSFFVDRQQSLPSQWASRVNDCRGGIAVDFSSRIIYWAKEPLVAVPIASMTKMMTAYLAVQQINSPGSQLSFSTVVPVTKAATAIGGRKVWLDPRETFTIDELFKCILIRSANDCAFLLGEHLGNGNESLFVAQMNQQAAELGLRRMLFHNTHGLPSEAGECMGAPQELAFLAGMLMEVPEIIKWTSVTKEYIRENTNKRFDLDTTNTLLNRCPGVNGMKTGMTNKAGYCIAVTCEREGRKVVVVLVGCPKADRRDSLAQALVEWVYTL